MLHVLFWVQRWLFWELIPPMAWYACIPSNLILCIMGCMPCTCTWSNSRGCDALSYCCPQLHGGWSPSLLVLPLSPLPTGKSLSQMLLLPYHLQQQQHEPSAYMYMIWSYSNCPCMVFNQWTKCWYVHDGHNKRVVCFVDDHLHHHHPHLALLSSFQKNTSSDTTTTTNNNNKYHSNATLLSSTTITFTHFSPLPTLTFVFLFITSTKNINMHPTQPHHT